MVPLMSINTEIRRVSRDRGTRTHYNELLFLGLFVSINFSSGDKGVQ